MAITVSIQLDGSSATYEVKHEIDGIYKATLVSTPPLQVSSLPEKVILLRSGDGWTSDCPNKIISLKLRQKIVEQERSSKI